MRSLSSLPRGLTRPSYSNRGKDNGEANLSDLDDREQTAVHEDAHKERARAPASRSWLLRGRCRHGRRRSALNSFHRWWQPSAIEHFLRGQVVTQYQEELSVRRRQPVGLNRGLSRVLDWREPFVFGRMVDYDSPGRRAGDHGPRDQTAGAARRAEPQLR
jgi:hypothetical protein